MENCFRKCVGTPDFAKLGKCLKQLYLPGHVLRIVLERVT